MVKRPKNHVEWHRFSLLGIVLTKLNVYTANKREVVFFNKEEEQNSCDAGLSKLSPTAIIKQRDNLQALLIE